MLTRIPLPTPDTMSEAQRKVYDEVVAGPRGAMRGPLFAALYNPELADRWQRLGELLRYHTTLSPRHTELVILITARASDCVFEWYAHEPLAVRAGLEPQYISAISKAERPDFTDPTDAAFHDFAFELQTTRKVTAATYQNVLQQFGPVTVVELAALIGYYTMVAMTLNAHDFDTPDGKTYR